MPTTNDPPHSNAYGHAEHSDDTRQAQHAFANDTPTDVNFNAIVARSQALTVEVAGQNYESSADARRRLFDLRGAALQFPAGA